MFGLFKKKEEKLILSSHMKGEAVPLSEVKDPTFSEEMLGKGMAVIPTEGKVYAPADGVIEMVFDTLHAVSMTSEAGVEIMIHVGLDTVMLKGEGFTSHVSAGDKVQKGDLLLTADLDAIRAAGYDVITPMVICNTDAYAAVEGIAAGAVEAGEDLIAIQKS